MSSWSVWVGGYHYVWDAYCWGSTWIFCLFFYPIYQSAVHSSIHTLIFASLHPFIFPFSYILSDRSIHLFVIHICIYLLILVPLSQSVSLFLPPFIHQSTLSFLHRSLLIHLHKQTHIHTRADVFLLARVFSTGDLPHLSRQTGGMIMVLQFVKCHHK